MLRLWACPNFEDMPDKEDFVQKQPGRKHQLIL